MYYFTKKMYSKAMDMIYHSYAGIENCPIFWRRFENAIIDFASSIVLGNILSS